MGLFSVRCSLSGVSLRGATQLVLLRAGVPCALPLAGRFDGYGGLEQASPLPPEDLVMWGATTLVVADAAHLGAEVDVLGAVASAMFDPPARVTLGGHVVSYALVDGRVAEAIAREVERSPSFAAVHREALDRLSLEQLAAVALFASAKRLEEPAKSIVSLVDAEPAPVVAQLREAWISFAQLTAWVRRFGAWAPAQNAGQLGWADELSAIDAARARFAAHAVVHETLDRLRAQLLADWRNEVPSLDDVCAVAGDRAAWPPRRPGAPMVVEAVVEALRSLPDSEGLIAAIRTLAPAAQRAVVGLLEAELDEETAELLSEVDGVVRFEAPDADLARYLAATCGAAPERFVTVEGEWGAKRLPLRPGRVPAVQAADRVEAGQVLVAGSLNLHARLRVLGGRAALCSLAEAVQAQCGASSPTAESLEATLFPLVNGFVRVVEAGQSRLEVGQVVSGTDFEAANEVAMAQGQRPATANSVLVGISEWLARR